MGLWCGVSGYFAWPGPRGSSEPPTRVAWRALKAATPPPGACGLERGRQNSNSNSLRVGDEQGAAGRELISNGAADGFPTGPRTDREQLTTNGSGNGSAERRTTGSKAVYDQLPAGSASGIRTGSVQAEIRLEPVRNPFGRTGRELGEHPD